MTGSQQKLYIDRDSARQFLFYKTDSKIPDIKLVLNVVLNMTLNFLQVRPVFQMNFPACLQAKNL